MKIVLLTALGVGGATVIGAVLGFVFKKISHTFSDIVLSFAAGVMLCAAVVGLILPSLEYGGSWAFPVTAVGKVLAVLLPALGMMFFPIFTIYVTNMYDIKQSDKD